jgi:hypothetical protein
MAPRHPLQALDAACVHFLLLSSWLRFPSFFSFSVDAGSQKSGNNFPFAFYCPIFFLLKNRVKWSSSNQGVTEASCRGWLKAVFHTTPRHAPQTSWDLDPCENSSLKATAATQTNSAAQQGDQIGRIFAYWAVVYFGCFLKITKVPSANYWATFSTVQVMH